jgi:isocitrate dehydrogenase (NAD+)
MSHDVTLIPGSGVGPAVAEVAKQVLAHAGVDISWDLQTCADGDISGAVASLRRTGVALKGALDAPIRVGKLPPSLQLRKDLGVDTILRHVKHIPGLPARAPGTDIVVIREASEDIYSGFEHQSTEGVFESVKVTTRAACERITKYAFDYAKANGRGRVTTVHKANIMKKADGLFLTVGRETAAKYPELKHDDVIVDALCMKIVRRPRDFDVLVCGNLFGDIVSDCAAGMAGGPTVAVGQSIGPDVTIFEAPHGAVVDGMDEAHANPYPMLVLAGQLARHLGNPAAAERIERAIQTCLEAGIHTVDMGGGATCAMVGEAVLKSL